MAKERLIGSDGKLVTVTYDDAVTGDDTQDLDELAGGTSGDGSGEGWYEVVSISDGTSALDDALSAGDLFWDDGTTVLATGTSSDDSVKKLIETEKADIQSFNLEFSRAEIDVTTLSDDTKRYRSGKTDMSGSLEGLTTIGVTDGAGYITDSFIRIISQASDGSVTVTEIDDDPLYIKGVVQGDTSAGETEAFVWAKVTILSYTLNAGGEDAQSFSSNFRIAPGNPEPTFYKRAIAST
jgi:hypothetical protein